MNDQDKSRQQLIEELATLRHQLAQQDAKLARTREVEGDRRRKQQLAQQYLDVAAVIMITLDKEGKVTLLNKKGHEILGYPEGMLLGKSWFGTCVPERLRADVLGTFSQLMAGQCEHVEYYENPVVTSSGEERLIAWNNTLLTDDAGHILGTLSSGMDITERRRAEEALQHAHDQLEERVKLRTAELARTNEELAIFRRFAEASTQGFGIASFSGEIIYANLSMCRLLGEERPEDVIGKHLSTYLSDGYMRKREKEVLPAITREGHWQGELTITRQGIEITCIQDSFVIRDTRGEPTHLATVVVDISERKQAEAALERERQTLLHMLRSSDHERRLISYDIHDGLAQQLAGAVMHFESYDQLREQNPSKAVTAYAAGTTLVRDSLAEARRLISGVRPPILDEEGVVAAINHLIHDGRAEAVGTQVEFHHEVTFNRLAPILENAVYRTVQEGLANALLHSQSEKVRVELVQHRETLQAVVQDWGVGFNPEEEFDGCFGLKGIRERARLLGGTATIESFLDSGTRIIVELPVVLPESTGQPLAKDTQWGC